ncbi:MAG: right-handed parallel beta-helix repeat-containing protein [Actinomycetota bacterium]|nr:right-handed parallel beta-helix repeat-containing protein [Actinomycetota bacterium]
MCTRVAPCKTITRAVELAATGSTISVAHGTYREDVALTKSLTIVGHGDPVVNAAGKADGFLLSGTGAAGATVKGFVVENATFEGILAKRTSDVTIADNVVKDNDRGLTAKHPVGECAPAGGVPGTCGQAIHLMSVTDSRVLANLVESNAGGGIRLTDELGPTALNLVAGNRILNNPFGCGMVLSSVNPSALSAGGTPDPSGGGVYGNIVTNNITDGNGVKGSGAGILLAGVATYDNVLDGNTANGNGWAGITLLHSFPPGQDNGNVITANKLADDGVSLPPPGSPLASFMPSGTVGIVVSSAVPVAATTIAGNTISDVNYGIWTANTTSTVSQAANTFQSVAVPLTQN